MAKQEKEKETSIVFVIESKQPALCARACNCYRKGIIRPFRYRFCNGPAIPLAFGARMVFSITHRYLVLRLSTCFIVFT